MFTDGVKIDGAGCGGTTVASGLPVPNRFAGTGFVIEELDP